MTLRLNDPAIRADPYPTYARLRATTPVVAAQVPAMGHTWLVTRYDDVVRVLKDPLLSTDRLKSADAQRYELRWIPRIFRVLADSMILQDDPDHARLRNLVHRAFTPRMVEQMAGRIRHICDELLDRAGARGNVDLIADFALPLPLTVISEMMGVPEADRLRFHGWSAKFLESTSGGTFSMLAQTPNGMRMMRFFQRLIALRKREPGDDLVSALVQAEAAGDRLSEDELLSMIFLLLLAGHETTVNLIGNGMAALLQHPDQTALLRAQPELIETTVEELLRFTNPVEHGTSRIAREAVEIAGVALPRGAHVLALISSANRDETVFAEPDRLDITRHPNRHIAFGFGMHYCLGAPLARLEGRIAIQSLVQRFPEMCLAVPPQRLRWRSSVAVRGLRELPVALR